MIRIIISKNAFQINKYINFTVVTIVFFSIALSLPNVSQPKNYGYTETTTGTIRRTWQKPNKYLFIFKLVSKQLGIWLFGMTIISELLDVSGLWGPNIAWVMTILTLRELLLGFEAMVYTCRPLWKVTLKATQYAGAIALIGAVFLSLPAICEASTTAVLSNSSPISNLLTTVGTTKVLQHPYCSQSILDEKYELIRKRYKISIQDQITIYNVLCEKYLGSEELLVVHRHIKISVGQLNRIRREWGLNGKKGRPKQHKTAGKKAIVPKAGVSIFSAWLDASNKHEEVFSTIASCIEQYKKLNPQASFRLLHARKETNAKKWKILTCLALLGINKLSELDYTQHDLSRVLGCSYSYSTLTQFLGELERIQAGESLRLLLASNARGEYAYIDAVMIAYWTRQKMHKGLITMNNKVMAGSKAVIAHDQFGKAIALRYYPPDTCLTHIIKDYCREIQTLTGIKIFIVDREINSAKTSRLFIENGWELLCLLKASDYKGPETVKNSVNDSLTVLCFIKPPGKNGMKMIPDALSLSKSKTVAKSRTVARCIGGLPKSSND